MFYKYKSVCDKLINCKNYVTEANNSKSFLLFP